MKGRTLAALVLWAVIFWAVVFHSLGATEKIQDAGLRVSELASLQCPTVHVEATSHDVTLITGKVDAAGHEAADGYFNIGTVSLSVPRQSVMQMLLTDAMGKTVEVRLRVVEKRELQEVKR